MTNYLKRALNNMRTYKMPAAAAILAIAMSTIIIASFAVMFNNAQNLVKNWEGGNRILIYLDDGTDEAAREDLSVALNSIDGLTIMRFIPKAEGLAYLKNELGPQIDLIDSFEANPLPDTYEVKVELGSSAVQNLQEISNNLKTLPHIADVEYGQDWIERGHKVLQFMGLIGWTLLIVFIAAGILIVVATIRLIIYALKDEIETARLIGASRGFIAKPFYIQSLIQTVMGSIIGLIIVYILYLIARANLTSGSAPLTFNVSFLNFSGMLFFIVISIVVAMVGTYLAFKGSFKD